MKKLAKKNKVVVPNKPRKFVRGEKGRNIAGTKTHFRKYRLYAKHGTDPETFIPMTYREAFDFFQANI